MSYYSERRNIKETTQNKVVAIATYSEGAEVIVKALNYYLDQRTFRENEAVEMMHNNTASSLRQIADMVEKEEYSAEMIIDWIREMADELEAQAVVVSLRDKLNYNKPLDTQP